MIKLVAFDWNGTLIADTRAIFESDNQVIKFLKIREASYKEFLELFDVPVYKYYLKLGGNKKEMLAKSKQIEKIFHEFYEKKIKHVRTRTGTRKLLEYLKSKNIPCIIISNHVTSEIIKQTDRLKITQYFTEILANPEIDIAFRKRSKKEKLVDFQKRNKIKSEETLIVGDAVEEIQIAKEIGAKVVAITNGNYTTSRLRTEKPDYLITNLLEIENILKLYA